MIDSKSYLSHHGIKGQRWGIRRYQNKDGSLTPAGQKRYDRDQRENAARKKENRIDVSEPDANRWVREDLSRAKKGIDESSAFVKQLKDIEQKTSPKSRRDRLDLTEMTDQELRQAIQREQLERQYNDLFGVETQAQISKGRQYARNALEIGGKALAVGSSALGIALAIKELRG